ncbi:MAG TPA: hypothetical protein VF554_10125 [Thermoanaerobaculia bacterium]
MSTVIPKPGPLMVRGLLFILLGLAGIAVGLLAAEFRFFGTAVAMFSFFLASSLLGKAGRLAAALQPLVGSTVRVEVWGTPFPAASATFDVDSITGFGAGLLIHLQPASGGRGSVLKVAQPRSERLEGDRIEIGAAAYVQWAGTRLKPPAGTSAPALVICSKKRSAAFRNGPGRATRGAS